MKYNVIIRYAGAIGIEIEADNGEKARQLAEIEFDEIDERELVANLADVEVCDAWEIENEDED